MSDRRPHDLSLDRLRDEVGWDPPAASTVADTTDTPALAAIAAALTPTQLEVWLAVAFAPTQVAAAELLGKLPDNVRALMFQARRRAESAVSASTEPGIHVLGRSAQRSRGSAQKETGSSE